MDGCAPRHPGGHPPCRRPPLIRLKPPFQVLIVEDEALLAMDIEATVEELGHRVVAEASCVREVVELPPDRPPNFAFVDLQLAENSSGLEACRVIRDRWAGVVIVFVTANPGKIPEDFCGAHGVIPKPFSRSGLMAAMRYIEEGVCDPPPTNPQPSSFIASPAFAEAWS